MSDKNPMPATDSARDLRNLVGDDVTADFETDPKFVDSNPTADASSENLAVLRDTDDEEESDDELEDEGTTKTSTTAKDDEDPDEDLDDDDEEEDIEKRTKRRKKKRTSLTTNLSRLLRSSRFVLKRPPKSIRRLVFSRIQSL